MNGKSNNMNNVLMQIYPDGSFIPPNELIAVFDADQIAKPDFFLRTVPLFDAGDDIGMVRELPCHSIHHSMIDTRHGYSPDHRNVLTV